MTRNTELMSIENVRGLLKGITPGPWNVQGAAIQGNRLICAPALNDIAIAQTVPRPWSIAAECADAKLMAAAPDLAALCLSLAAQLQQEREARERVKQLALKAHAAESEYLDLEAIERHMVLPQTDWGAHSLAVDKAYSLAQQAAWLVVHAALASEPQ